MYLLPTFRGYFPHFLCIVFGSVVYRVCDAVVFDDAVFGGR